MAIREIQIPGLATVDNEVLKNGPALSCYGAYFIWAPEAGKTVPHKKPVRGFYRTAFIAGKTPVEAIISAAAYNQAEFYLNGKKLLHKAFL